MHTGLQVELGFAATSRSGSHQGRVRSRSPHAGWPDGRRKFGTIGGTILAVLAQTDSEMRVKAIHAEVERVLGGSVSRYSVSDYILTRSKGPRPLFPSLPSVFFHCKGPSRHCLAGRRTSLPPLSTVTRPSASTAS